ncbi:ABC transporter ATP-binding protein [Pseudoalteromonas luteoviolacea]|uniref:ABC transporter ATP-binding protein n=1 Tax=Pseudoalteromonas luteoviolacea TaxID=43657 RepID=UPI001F32105D|nr:ABC transporter ATP-binding protein [Pseudoalteromonas luteoviolacea]MCF6438181.1 ABC transporter ATP-binding protein [Pseudoalteromonas luteoviolacea]
MLELIGVSKNFTDSSVITQALQPINLQVQDGDFISFIGPSGSGKTTLLNVLGLLETPCSGDYIFAGKRVLALSDKEKSRLRNRDIGYVFQGFHLLPDFNIYDNIEMPLRYSREHAVMRRKRVVTLLEQVGLSDFAKYKPSQLSGGQQQKAAIARALVTEPSVILADEPTGNLDLHSTAEVMALLSTLNQQGTTILMATHNLELAQRSKRVIEVRDGVIKERSLTHYARRWGIAMNRLPTQ